MPLRLRPVPRVLDHSWLIDRMLPAGSRNHATGRTSGLRWMPFASVLGPLVMCEPNPASRELVDRPLDVLDHKVQDRERCRCVVWLRIDQHLRPRSDMELETGWHVGAIHTQRRIDYLKPQGRAVETPSLVPRRPRRNPKTPSRASTSAVLPSLAGSPCRKTRGLLARPIPPAGSSPARRAVSCMDQTSAGEQEPGRRGPHNDPNLVGEVLLVEVAGCGRQLGQAQWPLV
jgi:hypothetical protein